MVINKAGIIIKDIEYDAHWIVELSNNERINMFNNGIISSFTNAIKLRKDIVSCFWNPLNDSIPKFGIIKLNNYYCFFIDGFAFYPKDDLFISNISVPKLFIRNIINMRFGQNNGFDKSGKIEYRAEIKTDKKVFSIGWTVNGFVKNGFSDVIHVGGVSVI